jgi:membrane protease YdiL (CAAX protease family)
MLLRPVRVLLSRIMPIDPDNFVHKIALFILTLILLSSFAPLIVLGGRPPLLEAITNGSLQNLGEDSGLSVRPIDLVYQFVWTIPVAFVAAGWPVARTFRAMLVRLGMVRPSVQQVLAAIALGLVLAFLSGFLDQGIQQLWKAMGWPVTNAQAFDQLLGKVITPIGAVLVGVTAGIGEEMGVRGLLQPRIGLIASNLVFTSLHAFQYGLDALLSVFIIGLVLGIIRARSNTTTSAITHGVYDFTLVFVSALAGSAGP